MQDDSGDLALEKAVEEAVDAVLDRVPPRERAAALRSLRIEMEQCLLAAPMQGSVVEAIRIRSWMAAILANYEPLASVPATERLA